MQTLMNFIWNHVFELTTLLGTVVPAFQQPKRKHGWMWFGLGVFADLLLIAFLSAFEQEWSHQFLWRIGRYFGQFSIVLGLVYVWLDCQFLTAVFIATMGYCLQHLSSRITGAIWCLLPGSPLWCRRLVLAVIVAFVFGGFYRILNRRNHTNTEKTQIANPMQLIISSMTMTVVVFLEEVSYPMIISTTDPVIKIANFCTSAVFALMILILELNVLKKRDLEQELATMRTILEEERSQYELEKGVVEIINLKCHDLKHQLRAIGKEMPSSEKEQIEQAVKQYDSRVKTGNRALDVVLTMKRMACESSDIELTCLVNGALLSFIEETDIYSLFGNLLDNAIEEIRGFDEEYRVINLDIRQEQQFVMISEENYIRSTPQMVAGIPQTTKGSTDYHGFGIRSMQMITEKYNGHLQITIENGVFHLDIMLPVPKIQQEKQ